MNREHAHRTHTNGRARRGGMLDDTFATLARLFERRDNGAAALRSIGVTSAIGREGVSTVAAYLAEHLAATSAGQVLLVDAHLAAPAVHTIFSLDRGPGLCEAAQTGVGEPMVIHEQVRGDLDVMTAGDAAQAGIDAIAPAMPELLDHWLAHYERIVFDLPPLDQSPAALDLAVQMDGVLMVVEAERLSRDAVVRAKLQLQRVGAKLVGAVLNKQRQPVPRWLDRRL